MDLSELTPMREASISAEQVDALFAEIQQLGSNIMLMRRQKGGQRADVKVANTPQQLEAAKNALLTGIVTRLQVRYHWQDQQWIDTLMRERESFHLVRIGHRQI